MIDIGTAPYAATLLRVTRLTTLFSVTLHYKDIT